MCDRITYCDIMECCEDCPRYGDDCDGDKRSDDLISRADAINAVNKEVYHSQTDMKTVISVLSALPSAEAEPTVIRSRTLMPTKDFKEWAKRIKEVNPNVEIDDINEVAE